MIGHSNSEPGELYYSCTPCGYTAPATIAIGLCPNCGDSLDETSAFA